MARKKTGKKRGRPQQANAKRRATTREGRRTGIDPVDKGSAELCDRKRIIAGGPREDLEFTPASVLFARDHLDRAQFDALGAITEWLRLSHAMVPTTNVSGLWAAIVAAASRTMFHGPSDAALGLAEANIRRMGWVLRCLDGSRELIVELAEGRCPAILLRAHVVTLTITERVALETPAPRSRCRGYGPPAQRLS